MLQALAPSKLSFKSTSKTISLIVISISLYQTLFQPSLGLVQRINGFQHLEKLMQAAKILPPSPENRPTDITPIQPTPTRRPPPLALPNEYDGNRSKGQAFLTSCQTYIRLCPDSFPEEYIKIT